MKTQSVIISEKGDMMYSPTSGVIIQGNIYTAQLNEDGVPEGRLIGNNFPLDNPNFNPNDINMTAYTWFELIEALNIPIAVLRKYVNINS